MHAALLYLLVSTTLVPALLVKGCNNCYFVNTSFMLLQAIAFCFIHYWCALLLLLQYSGSNLQLWLCDLVSLARCNDLARLGIGLQVDTMRSSRLSQ